MNGVCYSQSYFKILNLSIVVMGFFEKRNSVTINCICNLPMNMILEKIKITWVKNNYGTFLDEFHFDIKKLIRRVEKIIIKISRHNMCLYY